MKTGVIELEKPEMTRKGKELNYELIIDAPRDFASKTKMDANLMPKYFKTDMLWMKSFSGKIEPGEEMRMVFEDRDGNEYTSRTKFTEITPNEMAKYELETGNMPGKKIMVKESFEDYKGKTKYTVRMTFEEEEDLYKLMDIGWHLAWTEYITRFGNLVSEMLKEEKVPK